MNETQVSEIRPADTDPIQRLPTLGLPDGFALKDWPDYPALFGLGPDHVPALIGLAVDPALHQADKEMAESWAPTHAWRALAQLRAETAIAPLLKLIEKDGSEDTVPGALDDFADVFATIGPAAIPYLAAFLANPATEPEGATIAIVTLPKIVEQHPACRDECVGILTRAVAVESDSYVPTTSWAAACLLDLAAVESIDTIRAAFQRDAIDESICGDLEDVEIALGLRVSRATPKRYAMASDMSTWKRSSLDDDEWDDPIASMPSEPVRSASKIGRNEPCPCGSGKKYKKCCLV